jgi:hypothetical protein
MSFLQKIPIQIAIIGSRTIMIMISKIISHCLSLCRSNDIIIYRTWFFLLVIMTYMCEAGAHINISFISPHSLITKMESIHVLFAIFYVCSISALCFGFWVWNFFKSLDNTISLLINYYAAYSSRIKNLETNINNLNSILNNLNNNIPNSSWIFSF